MKGLLRKYVTNKLWIALACITLVIPCVQAQVKHQQQLMAILNKTAQYDTQPLDSLKVWTDKGIAAAKKENDSLVICGLYLNLSYAYEYHSMYPEALSENLKALRIAEKLHNLNYEVSLYGFQSIIYGGMNENKLAIASGEKAVKKAEELRLNTHLIYSYLSLARIYLEEENKSNYRRTEQLLLKADSIVTITNDTINTTVLYGLMGSLYSLEGKCEKALEYKKRSLNLCSPYETYNKIITNIYIAKIYMDCFKQPQLALPHLNTALEMNHKLKSTIEFRDCYKQLSLAHQQLGHYKEAYEYNIKYHAINDSILSTERQVAIQRITEEFETEKKQKAIDILQAENELHKEEASKKQILVWFLSGFIIIIILLLFFAQRAYRAKKKYTQILAEENERKELVMQEVHHRVNNSLQMISSLLSLQAHNTESAEVKEYLLKSEKRIHSMSAMHELLNESEALLELDIHDYLYRVIDFHKSVLESRPQVEISTDIPHVHFPTKISLPLALIVNELITNSLKYAFPDNRSGVIRISLLRQEEKQKLWKLSVQDDGIGMPSNQIPKKDNRLGLRIIRILSKQIGAQLVLKDETGANFEIIFSEELD